MVELLLHNSVSIDAVESKYGRTSLITALALEHFEVAQCLIEHGANVNLADKDGYTPLHMSASKGNRDMVELLLNLRSRYRSI